MKVLIVSGFLGAGKTTFIKELSKKTDIDFAIMENEYGEEGIDGETLKDDRIKIWELTEGCICCSLKSDFASSILTIANTVDPEFLIVEPTGVGVLSSVLSNIAKIEYDRIKLLKPITVVDINTVDKYINTFGDIYKDQIKHASRIIVSKSENSTNKELETALNTLASINNTSDIVYGDYRKKPVDWWKSILEDFYNESNKESKNIDPPDLENLSIKNIRINSVQELMEKLVLLMRKEFGTIYRAKGFVPINGQWTKFDQVNINYTIETSSPASEAKMVIIGNKLDKRNLEKLFKTEVNDYLC